MDSPVTKGKGTFKAVNLGKLRMKISVVIPTHRRPELLKEAMSSVAQQSLLPDELIVVDDADDIVTRQNVMNFALTWQVPTRYVSNMIAPGACGSRNLGAFVSAHEWIAFLDDDDVWQPPFLVRTAERAKQDGVDLVMSALNRQEQGRSDIMRSTPEGMTGANVLQFRSAMTGSNFLIRGTHFAAVRGFDPAMTVFNDWDLLVRLLQNQTRYSVVGEPLVVWRDHSGDRIATPSPKRADGIDKFLARYGHELPAAMRRELRTTALGIRRKCAVRPRHYLELSIALALAHGPVAALARFAKAPKLSATS
ncbi:MAG: glycosyltransferase family A protein [Sphingobium sp.]|uniref:glycosyltransferase family 2 protein n=1 Tax=Sphingobium sp. TaxID=1912891 RepID=UPI0029B5AFFA|nr:glycosyltransferase family A protein [Sphingobium sp.]MDX3908898.1 glycosyltransferase family A protein [Sphingobium sp.]